MTINTNAIHLFSGTPGPLGGLSNERELAAQIPAEFRRHNNQWTRLASSIFFSGANLKHWTWRTPDRQTRMRQLTCLQAVLTGFDLKHEEKEALAGWMLSEMLMEVPE